MIALRDHDKLHWKETLTILLLAAVALTAWFLWPPTQRWLVALPLIAPVLFVIALPFWHGWCIGRGLRLRTRARWRVVSTAAAVVVWCGEESTELPAANIASGRLAQNANWTDSRFLEDALTLFDSHGKSLLKIPSSADGFSILLDQLTAKGVPVSRIEVPAPAFLD